MANLYRINKYGRYESGDPSFSVVAITKDKKAADKYVREMNRRQMYYAGYREKFDVELVEISTPYVVETKDLKVCLTLFQRDWDDDFDVYYFPVVNNYVFNEHAGTKSFYSFISMKDGENEEAWKKRLKKAVAELAEEANKWNRENGEPERKIPKKYR